MFNYIKFGNFLMFSLDGNELSGAGKTEKAPTNLQKPKEVVPLPDDKKAPVLEATKKGLLDEKELPTITNRDFLRKTPIEQRLQYITSPGRDFSKVASGEQKEMTFTFTFNNIFNENLYMNTTAGQVLPREVNVVKIAGETYSRTGLKGEFFNSHGQRLIIREGTKIEIPGVRDKELIEKQEKENANTITTFIAENPNADKEIVKEAVERGIDPKFALIAFKDKYDKASDSDKATELEDMMTYFDKYKGYYPNSGEEKDDKYSNRLALGVIRKFNKEGWEEKAIEYGIPKSYIDDFKSSGDEFISMKADEIENDDSLPLGGYKRGDVLLKDEAFRTKLQEVCNRLGANFDDMVKLMKAESRLDPRVVNQIGAVGLIQFIPSTARDLGTSTGKIRKMTAVEQLDLVEQYFNKNRNGADLSNITQLYKVVFYPYSLRQPDDYVFGSHNSDGSKGGKYNVAGQNSGIAKFSTRADGLIDGHCFARYVQNHVSRFSV